MMNARKDKDGQRDDAKPRECMMMMDRMNIIGCRSEREREAQ